MMTDKPVGERFSHIYLEKSVLSHDSERLRNRVAAFYDDSIGYVSSLSNTNAITVKAIARELGVEVPFSGRWHVGRFLQQCLIRNFLDTITLIWRVLSKTDHERMASNWLRFVEQVFREEDIGYTVDEKGGVHFYVDKEFIRSRASVLTALEAKELRAVNFEAEKAFAALQQVSPDTKSACRHVFEAVEILFKLIAPDVSRLGSREIDTKLLPLLKEMYDGDQPAIDAVTNITKELGAWVNWMHIYRHRQRVEEPMPPPLGMAVLGLSTGASFLRFLADVRGWQTRR